MINKTDRMVFEQDKEMHDMLNETFQGFITFIDNKFGSLSDNQKFTIFTSMSCSLFCNVILNIVEGQKNDKYENANLLAKVLVDNFFKKLINIKDSIN